MEIILILFVNILLATLFFWVHKQFEYLGTRWFLVGVTVVLPFIGIIYFIILTGMRLFGKRSIPKFDV